MNALSFIVNLTTFFFYTDSPSSLKCLFCPLSHMAELLVEVALQPLGELTEERGLVSPQISPDSEIVQQATPSCYLQSRGYLPSGIDNLTESLGSIQYILLGMREGLQTLKLKVGRVMIITECPRMMTMKKLTMTVKKRT